MGYGITGRSVARHLLEGGDEVVVWDDHPAAELQREAGDAGVRLEETPLGQALERALEAFDLVVPSPGVPAMHPVLSGAARLGVKVRSEIDLVFDLPEGGRPDVLAVTGTNGKTTVTNQFPPAI